MSSWATPSEFAARPAGRRRFFISHLRRLLRRVFGTRPAFDPRTGKVHQVLRLPYEAIALVVMLLILA